jgi:hypothetical protein
MTMINQTAYPPPTDLVTSTCKWLHESLEALPFIRYPFDVNKQLPDNGIYFFYEDGEVWGHGNVEDDGTNNNNNNKPRIVRIGTHKDGNFKSRISEHFLLNESKMNFNSKMPAPHDRSIFRKNIGRALLEGDEYLNTWEIDFTTTANRNKHVHKRDIEKEKEIEAKITDILRQRFSFCFIILEEQTARMGITGLESRLIATVANCSLCKPSQSWLGRHSSKRQIREGKMWIVQHLKAHPLGPEDKEALISAIRKTKVFCNV